VERLGFYNNLRILYEEPCEPQDCPYSKTAAALSIDGTTTKVNKVAGTFQVDFKAMGRALQVDGKNVKSENPDIFLEKMSNDLGAKTLVQATLPGIDIAEIGLVGYIIDLKETKNKSEQWTATFEYGGDLKIKNGTKVEWIDLLWWRGVEPILIEDIKYK
jgi:hypothetical protein